MDHDCESCFRLFGSFYNAWSIFFRDQTLGATVISRNWPHMEQGLDAAMKRAPSDLPALLWFLPGFVKRRIVNRPNLIKILDNIGWLFFDKILRMGVGLIVGVWVARYLGPEQYGMINYAMAFVFLFSAISVVGMNMILVKELSIKKYSRDVLIGSAICVQLLGSIIAFTTIMTISNYIEVNEQINLYVFIFSLQLLIKPVDFVRFLFEADIISKHIVWIDNFWAISFSIIKIYSIYKEAQINIFVYLYTLEYFFVAISLYIIFKIKYKYRLFCSINIFFKLLKKGIPISLTGLAMAGYMRFDQIAINYYLNDFSVGIYSSALRITETLYLIPTVLVGTIAPQLYNLAKKNINEYKQAMENIHFFLFVFFVLLSIILSIFSRNIITMVYGEKYLEAAPILCLHCWTSLFIGYSIIANVWLISFSLNKIILFKSVISAISSVILNIIVIPIYGLYGAAVVFLLSQFISTVFLNLLFNETRELLLLQINPFFKIKKYCYNK